jgi:hypothetical protein
MAPQADNQVADQTPLGAEPEKLWGVSYLARQLGISRGYVSFAARHRMFPFLPTHACAERHGARAQALFTETRAAAILRCYAAPDLGAAEAAAFSGDVVPVYGVTYLAQVLGYSRTRLSPLVQERAAPYWPTHQQVREDGSPGQALFTAERIQYIVAVRRDLALERRYAPAATRRPGVVRFVAGTAVLVE